MKIVAQVNRIKNASEIEIEDAREEKTDSDFFSCTFPKYEEGTDKLLDITERICQITILDDKFDEFFGSGFSGNKKPLWSGYKQNKFPNLFSCTLPSFMKRPVKEGFYNTSKCFEIFCYTPQLCDRIEEANRNNTMPYVPFVEVNNEKFGDDFYPPDLASSNLEKKATARKAVINVAKIMCKENKKRLTNNFDNVIKFLPSDR